MEACDWRSSHMTKGARDGLKAAWASKARACTHSQSHD